jgi:hypothetical protein
VHDYDLDDPERFAKVLDIEVPWAHTYADTEPGRRDRERRDNYRKAVVGKLSPVPAEPLWWAFRIGVEKMGRALDVDNVAKTIIDAFCTWQINRDVRDGSPAAEELGLFQDDTIEHVRVLHVVGARGTADRTHVEIFACVK